MKERCFTGALACVGVSLLGCISPIFGEDYPEGEGFEIQDAWEEAEARELEVIGVGLTARVKLPSRPLLTRLDEVRFEPEGVFELVEDAAGEVDTGDGVGRDVVTVRAVAAGEATLIVEQARDSFRLDLEAARIARLEVDDPCNTRGADTPRFILSPGASRPSTLEHEVTWRATDGERRRLFGRLDASDVRASVPVDFASTPETLSIFTDADAPFTVVVGQGLVDEPVELAYQFADEADIDGIALDRVTRVPNTGRTRCEIAVALELADGRGVVCNTRSPVAEAELDDADPCRFEDDRLVGPDPTTRAEGLPLDVYLVEALTLPGSTCRVTLSLPEARGGQGLERTLDVEVCSRR